MSAKKRKAHPKSYYQTIKDEFDRGVSLSAVLRKYHTSEAMLKSKFKEHNIYFPKFYKGRPQKEISEAFIEKVVEYKSQFDVGYKRCSFALNHRGIFCSQEDVREVYDFEDLWKNSDFKDKKAHPNRFVARYANQLWHSDLHFVDLKQADNTVKRFYLIAFIDDRTRYVIHQEMFDHKSAANCCNALVNALRKVTKPYMLTLDNGIEFKSTFDSKCKELGILVHLTHPYTPQENGKVERFWPTLSSAIHDWNDVDTVVEEYNNHWPHSALKNLTGQDMTPKEAWDTFTHYEGKSDLDIIYE